MTNGDIEESQTERKNDVAATSGAEHHERLSTFSPVITTDERILSSVTCNVNGGGLSYGNGVASELGAVPEEDEEAATSSTPSTVVRLERVWNKFFNISFYFYMKYNITVIYSFSNKSGSSFFRKLLKIIFSFFHLMNTMVWSDIRD